MEHNPENRHTIAIFDFDGTLTRKDTMFQFVQFCFGPNKLRLGVVKLFPTLVFNTLNIITSEQAKKKFLSYFFYGIEEDYFTQKCEEFAEYIDKITNRKALEKLVWHKKQNHEIIIISASAENWIIPWAQKNAVSKVIATRLNLKSGKYLGEFDTPNCNGPEKVKRFLKQYPLRSNYQLYVYGDSKGDRDILALADYAFFRKF